MNRTGWLIAYGGAMLLLVLLSVLFALVMPVTGAAPQQLLDPTEQRATVNAMVEQRFTQTVEALNLDATADRIFGDLLTATAMVDDPPTQTVDPFSLTATRMVAQVTQTAQAAADEMDTATPVLPAAAAADIPQDAIDAVGAGWLAFWEQRDRDAVESFDTAVELAPGWAEGYIGRATLALINGDFEAAIDDLTRAIALDDNAAALYLLRGQAYSELLQDEDAIADYSRVIELTPNDGFAYGQRGAIYFALEDYDRALADFDAALRLNPSTSLYYDFRRETHTQLGNDDAASFDRFMTDALEDFAAGDLNSASEGFSRALAIESDELSDTDLALAYFNRAFVLRLLENEDAALEDLEAARELDPTLGDLYFEQQLVHEAQGDFIAAAAALDAAIENAPDFASAYLSRAFAAEVAGDSASATVDYWNWLELINTRVIDWPSVTPGKPFNVEMRFGYQYHVLLSGDAGQQVSATADMLGTGGSAVDPLLVILDADGEPIMSNDDGGEEFNSAIANFVLPAAGNYTLVIGHAGAGNSGPVEVNVKLGAVVEIEPTLLPIPTLTGTIAVTTGRLRNAPSLSAEIIAELPQNTEIAVLGQDENALYLYIRTPDGQEGWIARQTVTLPEQFPNLPVVTPTPPPTATLTPTPSPTATPRSEEAQTADRGAAPAR